MAAPNLPSTSGDVADYMILGLMSWFRALSWISDTPNLLHLNLVNAALDSREKLLTWLERRFIPSGASSARLTQRPAELLLVKDARHEAPVLETYAAELGNEDSGFVEKVEAPAESQEQTREAMEQPTPVLHEPSAAAAATPKPDRAPAARKHRDERVDAASPSDRAARKVWAYIRAAKADKTVISSSPMIRRSGDGQGRKLRDWQRPVSASNNFASRGRPSVRPGSSQRAGGLVATLM